MPFGKYSGLRLDQVPTPYLLWLNSLDDLREPLLSAVAEELDCRELDSDQSEVEAVPPEVLMVAESIIKVGLRHLALKNHPDAGGDPEAMKQINLAAQFLRSQLRGLRS